MNDRQVLQILVDDAPTVLARLALLLSRHDVELTALSVDRVEGAPLRLLRIELDTSAARVEQLGRRLTKMINVVEVRAA